MIHDTFNQLQSHISRRYADREQYDLTDFLTANHLFRSVDDDFVDFVFAQRDDILNLLADPARREALVAAMAEATKIYTWQRNQYIALPAQADALLTEIYRALTERSRAMLSTAADRGDVADAMRAVVDAHHDRLTRFFAAVCTPGREGAQAFLRTVPCDEYSAELQLRLLALDPDSLQEPVLDLGCGSAGTLVRFLRKMGIAAMGVDRLAPREEGFVRADWFDAPLDEDQWGTVLAHQSVSLHFLFHHHHATGQEERYTRLLMRVLRSLRPGGRFCCTPSLPFFEPFLIESPYRIERYSHSQDGASGRSGSRDPAVEETRPAMPDALSDIAAALHIIRPGL